MSHHNAPRNGDEQVRESVMLYVREKARDLAAQGLTANAIIAHVDGGGLNVTERGLLERIARQEVEHARRWSPSDSHRSRS